VVVVVASLGDVAADYFDQMWIVGEDVDMSVRWRAKP
jgi:hypothetical protein